MIFLKIFLTGLTILVVAIFLNAGATKLGITTWYPFLDQIGKVGFTEALGKASTFSKLFLFILYPLILGLTAYYFLKIYK